VPAHREQALWAPHRAHTVGTPARRRPRGVGPQRRAERGAGEGAGAGAGAGAGPDALRTRSEFPRQEHGVVRRAAGCDTPPPTKIEKSIQNRPIPPASHCEGTKSSHGDREPPVPAAGSIRSRSHAVAPQRARNEAPFKSFPFTVLDREEVKRK